MVMIDEKWPKPKRMCHHPELVPTTWNQPRPEPVEMVYSCECGENYRCSVCGWGRGYYPGPCMRARGAERGLRAWYEETSEQYAGAWKTLADS